jgi:hypothetical protein
MKKAGIPGTMDQLRARAYLHLLGGGTPNGLLTPPGTADTTQPTRRLKITTQYWID